MSDHFIRDVPKCRRVINGLAYDTANASTLYVWLATESHPSAPDGMMDALMQNVHGAYFAYSCNPECDDLFEGSEKIAPLSLRQAMKWVEYHCPHMIEEIFGRMPEAGEGKPPYTIVDEAP